MPVWSRADMLAHAYYGGLRESLREELRPKDGGTGPVQRKEGKTLAQEMADEYFPKRR